MTTLKENLKSHPFLQGLDDAYVEILEKSAMAVEFARGEMIFRAGDPANRFYLITDGYVALRENSTTFQIVRGGDVVGCSSLFFPYTIHFDVQALTRTKAIFIYGTWVIRQCEKNCRFAYEMVSRMSAVKSDRIEAWRRSVLVDEKSNFAEQRKETTMRSPTRREVNGRIRKTGLTADSLPNPMDVAVTRHGLEYVKAHVDDKHVTRPSSDEIDQNIAAEVKCVLTYVVDIPPDVINVSVRDRWVTLKGVLEDWDQRETVERVVGHVDGVRGITNSITVEPKAAPCCA